MTGYQHRTLDDLEPNPEKPGRRWELSNPLGVDAYNRNVAVLESGEPRSQNGYHYHESQAELFHVVENRCRAEVEDGGFTLATDDAINFEAGVVHLVHNPFEEPRKMVAIGSPPEGRYPVHRVTPADELLADRYGDASPDAARTDADTER